MMERQEYMQFKLSLVERSRLMDLCVKTDRDFSKMIRFLINREYAALFPQGVSVETVTSPLPSPEGKGAE